MDRHPKQAEYSARTRAGAQSLTRRASRSDEARLAPRTHWEERWLGVIHAYPKNPDAFEARRERGRAVFAKLRAEGRLPSRAGIPDGWGGRRTEIAQIKAEASAEAEKIMAHLAQDGIIDESGLDERAGNSALRVALTIVHDRTEKAEIRLKAAALIANFTKSRPTQTLETIVSPAEAWLEALAQGTLPAP